MLEAKFATDPIPLYITTSTNYMYGEEPFAVKSGTLAALVDAIAPT